MLGWNIYLSFLGILILLFLPRENKTAPRWIALIVSLLGLILTAVICISVGIFKHEDPAQMVILSDHSWIPALRIRYTLGMDGITLVMCLLTGIAAVSGVLFSWNVTYRSRDFFIFFMLLIGSVYGVFLSLDIFLFFVFYELVVIPKYFLIAIWGSTNKEYGAMKLTLYSFAGSALALIAVIAVYVQSGCSTFNMLELREASFSKDFQFWAFPMCCLGFGVLAGLWPCHTWAPTGHVAAPTAASMLLAGVIMKLGAYGILRIAVPFFPEGVAEWKLFFSILAVIGIVYGALVAITQKDFKFVIGYSSVSHMGFVILGLVLANEVAWNGAVLQMFSHGIIAGLLFAVVGRMVYERTHTRDLTQLHRMRLMNVIPFAVVIFILSGAASMGMPGFSGFWAELQVMLGCWNVYPLLTLFIGLGLIFGVVYTLRAINLAFLGKEKTSSSVSLKESVLPISLPEKIGAVFLITISFVVGIYPNVLLAFIAPAVQSMM
ncbi:MAG: NADH-quinone oxidoreductase subunit M [Verrucomicrobia bacterium]|nr:NADH-quinone oxidoreductase subunit M [Verrucomicrobiota bacterium]